MASVLAAGCLIVIIASVAIPIALQADGSSSAVANLLPTLATAGLMATGAGTWAARALLAVKPMVWLGKVSYPLYLALAAAVELQSEPSAKVPFRRASRQL